MSRLWSVAAALLCLIVAVPLPAQPPPRDMAVTIDDLPTVSAVRQTPEFAERLTADLLADRTQRRRVPARSLR